MIAANLHCLNNDGKVAKDSFLEGVSNCTWSKLNLD